MRAGRGSYIIIISLPLDRDIVVGRLGEIHFSAGWYAYVGSAMRGFKARLPHYQRKIERPHWHIDYLLQAASIKKVITLESQAKLECLIAAKLSIQLENIPGFGCSDCKCISHLFFSPHLCQLESGITLATMGLKKFDIKL